MRSAIWGVLIGVNTALPAIVTAYDPDKKRADVQIALKSKGPDGVTSRGEIQAVPVAFMSSGGFAMTMPIEPGDEVLCIFSSRSIERWLENGGEIDPRDGRKFDLNDAIAIPANMTDARVAAALSTVAFFGLANNSSGIKIHPDGKIQIGKSNAELLKIVDELGKEVAAMAATLTTAATVSGGTFIMTDQGKFEAHKAAVDALIETLGEITVL